MVRAAPSDGADDGPWDEKTYISEVQNQWHRLVRIVMGMGAGLADAENAAQESVIAGWQVARPDSGKADVYDMPSWLTVVAIRAYFRHCRRYANEQPTSVLPERADEQPGPEDVSVQTLRVRAALRCLSERERVVMVLDMEHYTAQATTDVLRELGHPEATTDTVYYLRKSAKSKLIRQIRIGIEEGGEHSD